MRVVVQYMRSHAIFRTCLCAVGGGLAILAPLLTCWMGSTDRQLLEIADVDFGTQINGMKICMPCDTPAIPMSQCSCNSTAMHSRADGVQTWRHNKVSCTRMCGTDAGDCNVCFEYQSSTKCFDRQATQSLSSIQANTHAITVFAVGITLYAIEWCYAQWLLSHYLCCNFTSVVYGVAAGMECISTISFAMLPIPTPNAVTDNLHTCLVNTWVLTGVVWSIVFLRCQLRVDIPIDLKWIQMFVCIRLVLVSILAAAMLYQKFVCRSWAFRAIEVSMLVVVVFCVVPSVLFTHKLPEPIKPDNVEGKHHKDDNSKDQLQYRWHFDVPNAEEFAILWDNNE